MRSSGDSDERGGDVVHDYVGCLPDDAAACLDVDGACGGWCKDIERSRAFVSSECWRGVECGEVFGERCWVQAQGGVC